MAARCPSRPPPRLRPPPRCALPALPATAQNALASGPRAPGGIRLGDRFDVLLKDTVNLAQVEWFVPASPIFGRCVGVVSRRCSGPRQHSSDTSRLCERAEFFLSGCPQTRANVSGGSPVTDVAYLCHNCGSVHEVESIRENLILDLRTAASYAQSGPRGMLNPRARLRRWRMTRGLAQALWPRYSRYRWLARGRGLVQTPSAPVSDRSVPCRAAVSASSSRAGNPALAATHRRRAAAASTPPPPSSVKS
jgi:hypothetical protein